MQVPMNGDGSRSTGVGDDVAAAIEKFTRVTVVDDDDHDANQKMVTRRRGDVVNGAADDDGGVDTATFVGSGVTPGSASLHHPPIVTLICKHLAGADVLACLLVCRSWHSIATAIGQRSGSVGALRWWRSLTLRDYPSARALALAQGGDPGVCPVYDADGNVITHAAHAAALRRQQQQQQQLRPRQLRHRLGLGPTDSHQCNDGADNDGGDDAGGSEGNINSNFLQHQHQHEQRQRRQLTDTRFRQSRVTKKGRRRRMRAFAQLQFDDYRFWRRVYVSETSRRRLFRFILSWCTVSASSSLSTTATTASCFFTHPRPVTACRHVHLRILQNQTRGGSAVVDVSCVSGDDMLGKVCGRRFRVPVQSLLVLRRDIAASHPFAVAAHDG